MALALFGLVVAAVLGLLLGVVRQATWISLIFSLAFALALLLEIAGGWQETTRPFRRRLLQASSFVLGVITLAVVAYREGWEAVLFLLIFLTIWHLDLLSSRRVISSRRFPRPGHRAARRALRRGERGRQKLA
jgi:hypothetical protein